MHRTGSKSRQPEPPEAVLVGCTNDQPAILQSELPNSTDSDHAAALGIIVSAFVDFGFGSSAAQQILRAANDNRRLLTLVDNFRRSRL